jgi:alkanesulfonate monooxygenase SsuD/methylene tetrahydromethanopterin reductase-like flavin-dependent oxidoreductase (luciferase family)
MSFPREYPAAAVVEFAEALEESGVDQLWVIEDCFYTAGISLAATALARTGRLQVGLGILPVVARNPAISAMEIATLAQLAPGRVVAGMGHGVQEWMGQMGARARSPLTALEETLTIVRRLLAGESLGYDGRMYHMDRVRLDAPPAIVPPVLAGVRQAKSLAVAGRCADGLVLAEGAGPNYIRWAIEQAAAGSDFHVSVFSALSIEDDATEARANVAPFLAMLLDSPNPALDKHSHIDEMREIHAERGSDGLVDMDIPAQFRKLYLESPDP